MKNKIIRTTFVSILLTGLITFIPIESASALVQGATTNGDSIGGSGGSTFTDTDCASGSIVTRISTSSTTNDGTNNGYITAFGFVCTPISDTMGLSTPTSTQTILGTSNSNSSCPANSAAVGFKYISTGVIADAGVICANLPGRTNINSSINTARSQTPTGQYVCPTNAYLIGFGGRKATGIDQLIPRCATFPVVTQTISNTTVAIGESFSITYSHFCPTSNTSRTFYDQLTGPGNSINTYAGAGSSTDGNLTFTLTKTYTLNNSGTWTSSPYINRTGCTGMVSTASATITVIDSVAPTFTSSTTFSATENIAISSAAATIKVSESATVTISSGADAALFTISNSDSVTALIKFKVSPNYEAPSDSGANNVYDLVLTATDPSNNAGTQTITITVTDVLDTSSFNSLALAGGVSSVTYRASIQINASVTVASKITFKAANVVIPGCKGVLATGSGATYTVSCSWKPSKRGGIILTATSTPTNVAISGANAAPISVSVVNRTGFR